MAPEVFAPFTKPGAQTCNRCKKSFESTQLRPIHDTGGGPSQYCCPGCVFHYISKAETYIKDNSTQRSGTATPFPQEYGPVSVDHSSIERNTSVSQRTVSNRRPVVPIGPSLNFQNNVNHMPSQGIPMPPPAIPRYPGHYPMSSHQHQPPISQYRDTNIPSVPSSGYTSNHTHFQQHYERVFTQPIPAKHVAIKAHFARISGKQLRLIEDVIETIPHVDVHIGAYELKQKVIEALLPKLTQCLDGYPLNISTLELKRYNFSTIEPPVGKPDIDAISDHFFKEAPNGKPRKFMKGTLDLYLYIRNGEYTALTQYKENRADEQYFPQTQPVSRAASVDPFASPQPPDFSAGSTDVTHTTNSSQRVGLSRTVHSHQSMRSEQSGSISHVRDTSSLSNAMHNQVKRVLSLSPPKKDNRKKRHRKLFESIEDDSLSDETTTYDDTRPSPESEDGEDIIDVDLQDNNSTDEDSTNITRKQPIREGSVISLDIDRLRTAATKQGQPSSKKEVQQLVNTRTCVVSVHLLGCMTLDEVFALKGDNSVFIHQNPPLGTLDVNWSSQIASIPGAFKTAHRGILKHFPSKDNDISDTIPSRRFPWDTPICIKRPYHLVKKKKKAHTPEQELILVLQELKTLLWADALLNFTYINIRRLIHEKGVDPDFPIPTLRYVEAALLMDQRNSGGAFIAEQYIPGDFCKYIDNRSCVPFPDLNSEQMDIAHFLSFVQHFIWSATEGKLLLTDFQGAGEFLTDPQLITPSEWDTDLFSGGNVESALKNFAEEHKCNHFCEYLGLDTVNKTIE